MAEPRQIVTSLGRLCEAGQHGACMVAGDGYGYEPRGSVWVCSCACHRMQKRKEKRDAD